MRKANLFFRDGTIVTVPVNAVDKWPEFIDHRHYVKTGSAAVMEVHDKTAVEVLTTRFHYYGVQYGVAAYVEKTP